MRVPNLIVFCTVILISSPANAYVVRGAGTKSCEKWIAEENKELLRNFNTSWLLGFISATAKSLRNDKFTPESMNNSTLIEWVDNYCKDHPLDNIATASAALAIEFQNRAK
jgi:hypothetical protein